MQRIRMMAKMMISPMEGNAPATRAQISLKVVVFFFLSSTSKIDLLWRPFIHLL